MPTIIDSLFVTLGLDSAKFEKGADAIPGKLDKIDKGAGKTGRTIDDLGKKTEKTGKTIDDLGTTTEKTNKTLEKIDKQGEKVNKTFVHGAQKAVNAYTKFRNEILTTATALLSLSAVKRLAENITSTSASTGWTSKNVGMDTKELTLWQNAVERTGGSAEDATVTIRELNKQKQIQATTGEIDPEVERNAGLAGIPVQRYFDKDVTIAQKLAMAHERLSDIAKTNPAKAQLLGQGMGFNEHTINLLMLANEQYKEIFEHHANIYQITEKDSKASMRRIEIWKDLVDNAKMLGVTVLTAVTPAISDMAREFEKWYEENKEWIILGLTENIKKLVTWLRQLPWEKIGKDIKEAVVAVGGLTRILEVLMAIWAVSKLINIAAKISLIALAFKGLGLQALLSGQKIATLLGYLLKYGKFMKYGSVMAILADDFVDPKEAGEGDAAEQKRIKEATSTGERGDEKPLGPNLDALQTKGEGGYNSVHRAGKGASHTADLSNMTVDQVLAAQKNHEFGAAGHYQFIQSTLRGIVPESGVKGSDKFDAETQDKLAEALLKRDAPTLWAYRRGLSNDKHRALEELSNMMAAYKHPTTGKGIYDGLGDNSASISSTRAGDALDADRSIYMSNKSRMSSESNIANNNANTSNSSSSEVHVGEVNVYTQATDSGGIARDIKNDIKRLSFTGQSMYGVE